MITTLVALTLSQTLVSFETKAERVPVVLSKLRPLTGLKLDCDGEFANEVIIVSVKDVVPKDLLDKIARVTTGEWEKKGETLILRPDAKRRAEQEKERMAARVAGIQKILDLYAKELEKPFDGKLVRRQDVGSHYAWVIDVEMRKKPSSRFMMRTLINLGATKLAGIERGKRSVFALNPNSLQQPFPAGTERALELLREEWRRIPPPEVDRSQPEDWTQSSPGWTVNADSRLTHLWVSIKDLLGEQQPVSCGISDGRTSGTAELPTQKPPAPEIPFDPSQPGVMAYDDRTKRLAPLIQGYVTSERKPFAPSASDLRTLLAPNFEPLSVGSELFLQYAKLRSMPYVGLINDNALPYYARIAEPVSRQKFEIMLSQIAKVEDSDGWLLTAPLSPADARRSRDDRKAVNRILKDAVDGHTEAETLAEYVAARPVRVPMGLGLRMAATFDREINSFLIDSREPSLRLYGRLTPAARKGGGFPFSTLSDFVRKELAWSIPYFSNVWPKISTSDAHDATYKLPNGIPPDSVLRVGAPQETLDIRRSSSKSTVVFLGGADVIQTAYDIFFEQNPQFVEPGAAPPLVADRFQPLVHSAHSISLDMGTHTANFAFKGTRSLSGPVTRDRLPAEYLQQIQIELDKLNKAKADGNPPRRVVRVGSSSQKGTPPP